MMTSPSKPSGNGRGPDGRFVPGAPAGPGRPPRVAGWRGIIEQNTDENDVVAVLDMLKRLALKGDVRAAQTWLSYVVGKPAEQPGTIMFAMPPIESAEDLARASAAILRGVSEGLIDIGAADRLAGLLRVHAEAVELGELARRVEDLEAGAGLDDDGWWRS